MSFGVAIVVALHCAAQAPAPRQELRIAAVGDIIFGWYTAHGYRTLAPPDVFAEVVAPLAADVVLGNLETPIVATLPDRSPLARGYRFGAEPDVAARLHEAGFSAVSIANNHAVDLVGPGLAETARHLEAAGVTALGRPSSDGSAAVDTLVVDGWRVAVVAATTWLNAPVPAGAPSPPLVSSKRLAERLVPLVTSAADDHDLVIVSLHWGREYTDAPENRQRHVARELAAAGADLVWGHHPHRLQGVEWIDGTLVAYSLGNFVFYEGRQPQSRNTAILELVRGVDDRWTDARLVPIRIEGVQSVHPTPATGGTARRIRRGLRRASGRLGTRSDVEVDGSLKLRIAEARTESPRP